MYSHQGVDRQVAAKQKRKELRTELKRNISIFKDRKAPKIFLVCNVCIGQSFFLAAKLRSSPFVYNVAV